MSVSYRFEDDLLEILVVGDHTVDDFIHCVQDAQGDEKWQGSAWLLIDISQSPAVTRRTPQEIRKVVDFLNERPGAFRHATALVVSSTIQNDVIRLAASMADFVGTEMRAFFQREEAVRWLLGRASALPSAPRMDAPPRAPARPN
jgi:hypothetical protein